MGGIQTKVFCPECGKEVELILEKHEIPGQLYQMMKALNLPAGNETAYKGEQECVCGKIVKITFIVEAVSVSEGGFDEKIKNRNYRQH
jgi:ssDNA-binding Zn-finger/Zn-ribbon topoisomerase 1